MGILEGSGVDDVVDQDELIDVDLIGVDPEGVGEVVELHGVDEALELHGAVIWIGGCRSDSQRSYPLQWRSCPWAVARGASMALRSAETLRFVAFECSCENALRSNRDWEIRKKRVASATFLSGTLQPPVWDRHAHDHYSFAQWCGRMPCCFSNLPCACEEPLMYMRKHDLH